MVIYVTLSQVYYSGSKFLCSTIEIRCTGKTLERFFFFPSKVVSFRAVKDESEGHARHDSIPLDSTSPWAGHRPARLLCALVRLAF